MISPHLDPKPAMQPVPSPIFNMAALMSELDYHRRKAEQLAMMNELHGRLARAIDLPGMIEALSVWLLPMVDHDLIAYNNPVRGRRYLFCSCHGPKRRKVMGLAANLLDQDRPFPAEAEDGYTVHQWRLDSQLHDRDGILLVCRNELGRDAMLLVKEALQVLREPLLRALEYEDLFAMANRDALTGLANRRLFEERIGGILENAKRHNRPVSLASMDLDHFKQINDSLGHAEGDRVLQRVAKVLNDTIRSTDLLVRMGGDEFVLVLNETTLTAAQNLANRICRAVDSLDIRAATGAKLGISIGIVQWQPGMDKEALLAKSDEILYRAKAAGRSRVHVEERLRFS